jgi:hypothetical protein
MHPNRRICDVYVNPALRIEAKRYDERTKIMAA